MSETQCGGHGKTAETSDYRVHRTCRLRKTMITVQRRTLIHMNINNNCMEGDQAKFEVKTEKLEKRLENLNLKNKKYRL